jgi:transposase
MSVQPGSWPPVPEETARVARAAFPRGSLAMRVRDELGGLFEDAALAGVYGARGRPGLSPAQLAVVTVLQFTENLTDRQAADAVRGRIDWKYCLGLDLADQGFDFSVLSEFRARLVAGGQERLLLEVQLRRLAAAGLVAAGMRQRTDSTKVLARIRDLNRLELAGETVRAALEALAAAVPGWLAQVIDASWQDAYGRRICEMRLPQGKDARARLAERYARDGYHLLEQAGRPGAPPAAAGLPALEALRLVLVQQFYRDDGPGGERTVRWREDGKDGLPPGRSRVISPYDTDARYGEKHHDTWAGYKAHYSETVTDPALDDPVTGMPGLPSLVTNAETTRASVPDAAMTEEIHDHQARAGLPPGEHLTDCGYASADALVSAAGRGITLTAPLLADCSWQARSGGYTAAAFTIDFDARQATCPQGTASVSWWPSASDGHDIIKVRFPAAACRACPARAQCTTAARRGRQLSIRPRHVHQAVTAARAEQQTTPWQARYAARAGVEGLMRQAAHATGIRHARYLGLPKTTLEHNIAAAAINLIRLDAWWTSTPPDRGHPSHLRRLKLAARTD